MRRPSLTRSGFQKPKVASAGEVIRPAVGLPRWFVFADRNLTICAPNVAMGLALDYYRAILYTSIDMLSI